MRLAYADLPLSFEQNAGQAPGPAKFFANGRGYRLELAPDEAVLSLSAPARNGGAEAALPEAHLHLKLMGANPNPSVEGTGELAEKSFYFVGRTPSDWKANVPNFGRVTYKQVYPGIDLIYYGNQQQLEYDFTVLPGADPNVIHLQVTGAQKVTTDAAGNLVLQTSKGHVELKKPVIYQQKSEGREEIGGKFLIARGNEVAFSVGHYDRSRPLIIDPVLRYTTYVGRTVNDQVNGIALGPDGTTYVAGVAAPPTGSGPNEAFVAHLAADGKTPGSFLGKTHLWASAARIGG